MEYKTNKTQRNSEWAELNQFCHYANSGSFIEVTEWTNGEGVDVLIRSSTENKRISLTWGEIKAIINLTK